MLAEPANPEPDTRPMQFSSIASPKLRSKPYFKSTITQTGRGEPNWNLGQQYRLQWSGPVTETRDMRLLVSPPWLTRFLRVLSVVLLVWLIWRLIRLTFPGVTLPAFRRATAASASVCLALLLTAGLGFPTPAAAQQGALPSKELLEELKTRLLQPPECAPQCVDVAEARIEADANILRVTLTAHVEASAALALPAPGERLDLRGVHVNGAMRPALRVNNANYITLPRGIHHVQLEYMVSGDTASLSFPIQPARIEFASAHWQVEGVDENQLLSGTLNFSRAPTEVMIDHRHASPPVQPFPPYVRVIRELDFDLTWSIRTHVNRISPEEGGFSFPVSLLNGEHVTTPEVKVQDGRALAVFAGKNRETSWESRLDIAKSVELLAPPLSSHAEIWRITVSPSWRLEWNGVPVILSEKEDRVAFEFRPLPGEKLVLTLRQPEKTRESVDRAIDRTRLESHVGRHATDITLEFRLRASQAGEHFMTLPKEWEILDIRRDNVELNLQAQNDRLSLPVSPGAQTYTLRLRHQGEIGVSTSSPQIDLGLPRLQRPPDELVRRLQRIAFAHRPRFQPAPLGVSAAHAGLGALVRVLPRSPVEPGFQHMDPKRLERKSREDR